MGVSKNRGTPKWMVYNGKPYWIGWFGGKTTYFWKHPYIPQVPPNLGFELQRPILTFTNSTVTRVGGVILLIPNKKLGGGFNDFLFSPLFWGRWSNLTDIFQRGWNHQLENQSCCVWASLQEQYSAPPPPAPAPAAVSGQSLSVEKFSYRNADYIKIERRI